MSNSEKSERLLSAIGQIREEAIAEADVSEAGTPNPKKARKPGRNRPWIRGGILAACLCLAVLGGVLLFRPRPEAGWPVKQVPAAESSTSGEIAQLPPWDEQEMGERYQSLSFEGAEYGGTAHRLDAPQIGGLLGQAVLSGQDLSTGENHSIGGTIYRIQGIQPVCAVAVQFAEGGGYYVYRNSGYRPETLGQFIDDLNLRETLRFGSAWYTARRPDGEYATIEFVEPDDAVIWEMLLSDGTLPNVWSDTAEFAQEISVSVDIPLLGYENISLWVTEDGYLATNILDTGKAFFIGEEAAQSFVEYVLENCEGYEIVYTDADGGGEPE